MPQNFVQTVIDNVKTLVANLPTFQAIVDADDASEALPSIHFMDAEDDGSDPIPRAIVGIEPPLTRVKSSSSGWSTSQLTIWIAVEVAIPGAVTGYAARDRWFAGLVEGLLNDLESLSGTGTYLALKSITIEEIAVFAKPEMNEGAEFMTCYIIGEVE